MTKADTNVLRVIPQQADREIIKPRNDRESHRSVRIGTITAAEPCRGTAVLPEGRGRKMPGAWCERIPARRAEQGRVARFDFAATRCLASGMGTARAAEREGETLAIAAMAATAFDAGGDHAAGPALPTCRQARARPSTGAAASGGCACRCS